MVCAIIVLFAGLSGCASKSSDFRNELVFSTPEAAANALAAAAISHNTKQLEAIFGPGGRESLSSGDPVADRSDREVFAVAIGERWSLRPIDSETRELVIGHEEWPFPIPLVKDARGWWFNTSAGKEEVLARRIGRNELATIGTLQSYVLAQREYAGEPRDGRPAGVFAQKIRSDPGRRNGLYWEVQRPGEPLSPLGGFVAKAVSEGYSTTSPQGMQAYHGYFFRILTRQGAGAPGGAKDYIIDGDMTGGFAMIAYPAQYGKSGIMTFLVGPDGRVFESDLGENSAHLSAAITEYNPDSTWTVID